MKRLFAAFIAVIAFAGVLLPGTASALTFSPPTFDLVASPGEAFQQTLKLRNEATSSVTITSSSASFAGTSGDDTSGVPDFYPSTEERDGHGLGGWIELDPAGLTLLPGERADLTYMIRVPEDAAPGSYFGAVILSTATGDVAENVGVAGTAAALVLLRVRGEVVEDMKLTDFSSPAISSSLPVRFEARVQNDGTVHLRPYGEVAVKNVFGKTVRTLAINRAEYKSVLPGAARRYQTVWQRHPLNVGASLLTRQWRNFALGPYTAELTFRYGAEDRIVQATTRFWVVPWLVLLLFAGGATLLTLGLRGFIRWYAEWVIRRYQNRQ